MKPVLVILAAGASRRLGTCKALVDLGGRSPLGRLLAEGAQFDDGPAMVVTGAHHDEIAASTPSGVEVVHNPDWPNGRTGSVQAAARRRPGRDLVIAPVDVPLVPKEVFEALEVAWGEAGAPPYGWLAPQLVAEMDARSSQEPTLGIGGTRPEKSSRYGHPVVIGRDLALRSMALEKDAPLRLLRDQARPLTSVAVNDVSIVDDLDGPNDLALLRARLGT